MKKFLDKLSEIFIYLGSILIIVSFIVFVIKVFAVIAIPIVAGILFIIIGANIGGSYFE